MKRSTHTIVVFALAAFIGCCGPGFAMNTLNAAEPSPSVFQSFDLKHGITLKIPRHWQILESQLMKQIDTNTEILTGNGQGDNDIVIASNFYDGRAGGAAATARVSVRTKQTLSQGAVDAMSQGELDAVSEQGYQVALSALEKSGDANLQISRYHTTKEKISGYIAMRTDYQEINPERKRNVSIYLVCLGNRNIKITLSYDVSQASILLPTIEEIKNSVQITK